jgi:hypothetical protein
MSTEEEGVGGAACLQAAEGLARLAVERRDRHRTGGLKPRRSTGADLLPVGSASACCLGRLENLFVGDDVVIDFAVFFVELTLRAALRFHLLPFAFGLFALSFDD